MKKTLFIFLLVVITVIGFGQSCLEMCLMRQSIEPSYGGDSFWFPDHREIQGIANDGQNWYLTTTRFENQTSDNVDNGYLWKIPLTQNINAGSAGPGVQSVAMSDIQILDQNNWNHFGDCDYFVHNGQGYILVPTYETNENGNGVIACFRASDLSFVNYGFIPQRPGWCAIDNNGQLYTKGSATKLRRYNVEWDDLTTPGGNNNSITSPSDIPINFASSEFDQIYNYQGGEFNDTGDILYLSSGSAGGCIPIPGDGCELWSRHVGSDEPRPSDGLHVIRVSDWRIIETSMNTNSSQEHFLFLFDADVTGENPQGVTYWNLDDNPNAGNLKGKVHVMMLDFDFGVGTGDHEYSFYHFSDRVYVDHNSIISSQNTVGVGGHEFPFPTFNEAFEHYPIWNGSTIVLKNGTYDDTGVYDKCVKLISEGGSAVIGVNE